ncbi:hypothetical protein FB470_002549 [Amycolatopsis thermophila]|uniref:Uncharacterized protein n=1 Tax=Amycolatopsis thermophila TaxID=206084 RepID=A0ABU0ETC4_9PSEU|nr:hypothetical protein [Amycolatopsis thermophila]
MPRLAAVKPAITYSGSASFTSYGADGIMCTMSGEVVETAHSAGGTR